MLIQVIFYLILGIQVIDGAGIKQNYTKAGCGDDKVRGVNLGNWFVLEPWMSPSFFDGLDNKVVDEWTLAKYTDEQTYKDRLKHHWDTWITRDELVTLVNSGISHMRIPLAYWYFQVEAGEPFPQPVLDDNNPESALFYLKRGLKWMEELGVQVILQLHTGPGSQNGYDNSGHQYPSVDDTEWITKDYPKDIHNLVRSLWILDDFSKYFRGLINNGELRMDTIYGIGIMNEPHVGASWNANGNEIWNHIRDDFYPKALDTVRQYFKPEEAKVIVDVTGREYYEFNNVFENPNEVEIDHHIYQCFGGYWGGIPNNQEGFKTHLDYSCEQMGKLPGSPIPVWVGEFSLGLSNTGFNPDFTDFYKNWFLAQIDGFESGRGWVFWNAKMENHGSPEWDYLSLLEKGIVPADLCQRQHYCY